MDKRTSGTPQDGGTGDDLLPWLPLSRQQDRGQDQGHRPPQGGAAGPRLPAPSWPSLSGSAPAGPAGPGAPPPPGRAPAGPRSAGAPPTGTGSRTTRPHQEAGPTAHASSSRARPGRAQTPPGGARRTTAPPSSPRAGLPSVTDADPSTIWAAGTYRAGSRSTRVSSTEPTTGTHRTAPPARPGRAQTPPTGTPGTPGGTGPRRTAPAARTGRADTSTTDTRNTANTQTSPTGIQRIVRADTPRTGTHHTVKASTPRSGTQRTTRADTPTGTHRAAGPATRPARAETSPTGIRRTAGPATRRSGGVAPGRPGVGAGGTRRGAGAPVTASPAGRTPARPSAARSGSEPPTATGAQRAIGATLGRPRPRGRVAWALAVVVVLAIVVVPVYLSRTLTGGPAPGATNLSAPTATVPADAPLQDVLEVAGRLGSTPIISLKGQLEPAGGVVTDRLITGQGRTVNAGDAVLLSVSTFSGRDGANTTGTRSGHRLHAGRVEPTTLGEVLSGAVTGQTEGSRIVVRAPVSGSDGLTEEVTVVDVLPTTATGQELDAPVGTPSATLGQDGCMAVSAAGLPTPTRSSATVVVQGDGPQVTASDTIVARYTTVGWADDSVLSSTYGTTTVPGTINMASTMAGIAQHLLDIPVGSRVILSLPADQARGDQPVAVVIDVLAVAEGGEGATGTPRGSATPSAPAEGATPSTPPTR